VSRRLRRELDHQNQVREHAANENDRPDDPKHSTDAARSPLPRIVALGDQAAALRCRVSSTTLVAPNAVASRLRVIAANISAKSRAAMS
jgi:hypothetical protein